MSRLLWELARSRRVAVGLLIALAVLAASGTLLSQQAGEPEPGPSTLRAAARFLGIVDTYRSPVFLVLVALIALNMVACSWHRSAPLWRRGGGPLAGGRRGRLAADVAMHLSLLAILAGGAGKALWGTVRTQNVHVGAATETFYDFTSGRDEPLGFAVEVLEREDTWYPVRAQIGVSDAAGAKIALVEAVEGQAITVPRAGIELRLAPADPAAKLLRLTASGPGGTGAVELETLAGGRTSGGVGDLRLTLVAWRRDLKGIRGRIACGGGVARKVGWISPRERVTCGGVGFALTAWGEDADGRRYVGIQAVRDPTAPLFWGGCVAFAVSLALSLAIRAREPGRGASLRPRLRE